MAKEFVNQAANKSSFSLFEFKTEYGSKINTAPYAVANSLVECTKDTKEIIKSLDNSVTVFGQTTLLDAIEMAALSMDGRNAARCGDLDSKNLIVISDGEDRASLLKPTDLLAGVKQIGVKIYFVGLIDDLDGSAKGKVKKFFERLSSESGGKAVFPKTKQSAEEIVKDLLAAEAKPSK